MSSIVGRSNSLSDNANLGESRMLPMRIMSSTLPRLCTGASVTLLLLTQTVQAQAPSAVVAVDLATVRMPHAPRLLGTSFDGRTGVQLPSGAGTVPAGYFDAAKQLLPGVAPLWSQIRLTTVRYPGNATDLVDWRETVGPMAGRTPQPINGGTTQVYTFGFDDFMSMVATHNPPGLPAPEVQIMVSTKTSLTVPTQAEVIQMAADWVEYANAPDNGSNPGGGTDWAAVRTANGHEAPYDIRIWNIGNEPWGASQPFDFLVAGNAAAFAALAQQFVTAMKAIDPTIQITLPSPARPFVNPSQGVAIATWDNTMLSQLGSQIFGLSMHPFYDETLARGVTACASVIDASLLRIANSASPGVKLVLGDHAHSIPDASTAAKQDYAMQWQAALTHTDLLLMTAQKPVEWVNFWIYGMPTAVWHPIRRNADATYTLMPAAGVYALMAGSLHDEALAVTTTSPPSTDGSASYSVRAGAFRSSDGSRLGVMLVNRDTLVAHTVSVTGLGSYSVTAARLLTASGATADAFTTTDLALQPANGLYAMPAGSILILDALVGPLSSPGPGDPHGVALSAPYPNPARGAIRFDVIPGAATSIEVVDAGGRHVRRIALTSREDSHLSWDLTDDHGNRVAPGIYYLRPNASQTARARQVVVLRAANGR